MQRTKTGKKKRPGRQAVADGQAGVRRKRPGTYCVDEPSEFCDYFEL